MFSFSRVSTSGTVNVGKTGISGVGGTGLCTGSAADVKWAEARLQLKKKSADLLNNFYK